MEDDSLVGCSLDLLLLGRVETDERISMNLLLPTELSMGLTIHGTDLDFLVMGAKTPGCFLELGSELETRFD